MMRRFTIQSSQILLGDDPTSENQMADNGATNEFTIMDPDGIQIVIRTK